MQTNSNTSDKSRNSVSIETLLLSQEMFKGRITQIATSVLLLVILGIQVYLFVGINQILRMAISGA
ncbi:hypothetical protein K9L63_02680 [Candidatus Gracilibacteria bacterium]|nr:hypothetical protein [Candidatus Gracilibacteria bacterium]